MSRMIIDGPIWVRWSMFKKWLTWCLKPTADNGQFCFEMSMNIYCGIQWNLLFLPQSSDSKTLKLMQVLYNEEWCREGSNHCLWLKLERISFLTCNGTFQGTITDPDMLSDFLVISTFPVLPAAGCLRLRVRVIKNYSFKTGSATMCVLIMHSLFGDQENVTFIDFRSPLAVGSDKFLRIPGYPGILRNFNLYLFHLFNDLCQSLKNSFSLLLHFKICITCSYLIICIVWMNIRSWSLLFFRICHYFILA